MRYSNSGEMLVMSSNREKAAVRIAHVTHEQIFQNFPLATDSILGRCSLVDFSPNDGYVTLGCTSGRALLYRLSHYPQY